MDAGLFLLSLVFGYLIGSIPFPQIIVQLRGGPDLREVGPKNVGAYNAVMQAGNFWGGLAFILDVAKGVAALAIASAIGVPWPAYLLAGLAAIIGHNYPIWLRFHGGKGAATGLGVSLWVAPIETVIGFIIGSILFKITRNFTISVGSAFLIIFALTVILGRQTVVSLYILAILAVMIIAVLPEAIRTVRTPGAVREYFSRPSKSG